jgi:hypothetical protein
VLSVLPPLAVAAVFGTAGLAAASSAGHAAAVADTTASPSATGASSSAATPSATTPTDDGSLSAVSDSVAEGSTLTFDYAVGSAADVNSENWIGIYDDPGCGPVNQTYDCGSNTYNWVTSASGTSSFNTSGWAPGAYTAYLLYDNGYTWLAKPVTFTITAGTSSTPPDDGTLTTATDSVEQGEPITFDYAVGESSAVNTENWVSPWTAGGYVDSTLMDHTSLIRILERRFGVTETNISAYRREIMGDFTGSLQFHRAPAAYPAGNRQLRRTTVAEEFLAMQQQVANNPAPTIPTGPQTMPTQG